MVYVASDGTVHQSRPWGVGRISDYFWGMLNFAFAFSRTLVPSIGGGTASGSDGNRSGGGSGGTGGPGGPRRRIGGITNSQDSSVPGCGCAR